MQTFLLAAMIPLAVLCGCRAKDPCGPSNSPQPLTDPTPQVNALLDRLHKAAARADFDAYFNCFDPSATFLGTDATERWSMPEFRAYCKPYFDQGKGWTYVPRDRHLKVLTAGTCIAFDELLENEKYGTCRGTGIVAQILIDGRWPAGWKIIQYNLSFMIPNDKAADVTAITKPK